ncbi:hypothetical protein [Serratia marcescens]|uniref:hypothetical protein n=1 Tax=Serratia marcescens TaxID=615 RepID=UPI001F0C0335|nr:hypothetical protein [Serratia marcescens]
MKKWILSIISLIVSFVFFVVVIFEFSFRFLNADNVIAFMDSLGFLGFRASFDSWVIFLILLSILVSLFVSGFVFYKLNKAR